jgi:hypothetical protein
MKNMIMLTIVQFILVGATYAQGVSKSYSYGYKQCQNFSGSFYPDDFGNSICLINYKYPRESKNDISLYLVLEVDKGRAESIDLSGCTMLSANHGDHSYSCQVRGAKLLIAHYQRGNYKDNRIWVQEISSEELAQIRDHESHRQKLRIGEGAFELKDGGHQRNSQILSLM